MAEAEAASRVVIVGAGQAGLQTATELRLAGHGGPISLIGEEPRGPYHRPPLSKAYLTGEKGVDALTMRAPAYLAEQRIDLLTGVAVTAIDRAARTVALSDGSRQPWDHLVLATGGRVRRLGCPGHDLDGVVVLRSLADADDLKARLASSARLVVVGAGFIGLEVAASARKLGAAVTVIEMQDRVMARAVGPEISAFFAAAHRAAGVDLRFGEGVASIEGEGGEVAAIVTAKGERLACDLVLVGIGVLPEASLAEAAGLAVKGGVVVDARQRTSDPAILALGDCAVFPHPAASGLIRLESVQNAVDQAKVAAATIMGREAEYAATPWFWSDQYDLKLQMVGLSAGFDAALTLGDPAERRFSQFYFREGRLIAIDSVNRPADHMRGRKLLAEGRAVGPDEVTALFAAPARA
jgi:3-phenylpropionate/trans-cinnamate dioxygenase ferredoxin reductase subunit